ncbi:MAG: CDP-glucose 4,6-dehydratase [Planctomycetes bacterium]|nr:CDP-glucose 4,6-dehydratase [Planctomycetota bacterium]
MGPFGGAFAGRSVLVTGHTGFKGAWLCAWLLELDAKPAGFALKPSTEPSLFEAILLGNRINHRLGDLRDIPSVCEVTEAVRPDLIIHMAAEAIVRRSYEFPAETFDTNVMGTVNVLEAVRQAGRPCAVIVVTSDKCYENTGTLQPSREGDPLGGRDPYSASKGCAEIVSAAYRRSFFAPETFTDHGVALASVRAGNVIGGGDWAPDRIVPDIVRALGAGRPVGLRNPKALRPWQHVLDALSGYLWLAARMLTEGAAELAEAWNFGPEPGLAMSVEALTQRFLRAWPGGRWEPRCESDPPHEAAHLRLDIAKARRRLSWRPVYSVDQAIDATVDWYKAAESGGDMVAFTARQIREYVECAHAKGATWATGERVQTA